MIDIHAHILPGVDDGAADHDVAVLMAQQAQESGVTDIIATPHANQRSRYENYVSEALDERLASLQTALRGADTALNVHAGMEVFGTPDVAQLLRAGKVRTLAGSRYLLVEFAFREDPFFMERTLYALRAEGVLPIMAHPERYQAVQDMPEIVLDWARGGFYFQINKGSLSGNFGRAARHAAHLLLAHGLVSFVASDAHGVDRRTPELGRVHDYIAMEFSRHLASRLLTDNPGCVLRDEPLPPVEPIPFF